MHVKEGGVLEQPRAQSVLCSSCCRHLSHRQNGFEGSRRSGPWASDILLPLPTTSLISTSKHVVGRRRVICETVESFMSIIWPV